MMEELRWMRQQLLEQQQLLEAERLRRQEDEKQVLELRKSLLSANNVSKLMKIWTTTHLQGKITWLRR